MLVAAGPRHLRQSGRRAQLLEPDPRPAGECVRLEGRWLLILGLYDLVFGLLAYAIFDFLLEE